MRIFAWAVAALLLFGSQANADIRITEVMSSSGSGGTPDWFELTNFSGAAVNVTGWKMDDDSFSIAAAFSLNGVTSIGAGESVVFVEGTPATTNSFKAFWFGATPPSGLQVGFYSGSGVSFGSGGDGAVIFNNSNVEIFKVTFGAATAGKTFDNSIGSPGLISSISSVGVNGAFQSANSPPANIGSPGAVPEPSALGLLAVAGVVAGGLRRKRS
jgi:hypothetical protein